MFMPSTITQGKMVHFMTDLFTLWLGLNQLMIRQPLSLLVIPMLLTLFSCSQSLLTDRHGRDALLFVICLVMSSWCAVPIILLVIDNLVMKEVSDIVNVVVGTPFGTSDHCFVRCVLRVVQSFAGVQYQKYCLSQTLYQLWQSPSSAVTSFTWRTI